MKKIPALGLGLVIVLFSCSKKVSDTDVPGTYLADYGFAKETLKLTADGKFNQEVQLIPSGRAASAHGTWRFDQEDSDIYFSDDFLVVADGFGKLIPDFDQKVKRGIGILPVRMRHRNVQIAVDPAVPYKKLR